MVPRVVDVEIRQFWTKKWTDVLFPSFLITQILPMKKKKTQGAKNEVSKSQGAKKYLTQENICEIQLNR
jgi:hypothetical protein